MKEQARERDVSASHEAVYVDPELLKNHIEPPHTTSSQDTIFSRTRRIQGPAEVDIVDLSSNPLPTPPKGMIWKRDENGEWKCVSASKTSLSSGQAQSEERARCSSDEFDVVWIEHVVMPEDTIRGICLKYRCKIIDLRRYNNFSGNAFRSRKTLRIKVNQKFIDDGLILIQDKSLVDVKIQELKYKINEPAEECMYYLRQNDYDVDKAFMAWKEDEQFTVLHYPPLENSKGDNDDKYKMNSTLPQKERNKAKKCVSKAKKDL